MISFFELEVMKRTQSLEARPPSLLPVLEPEPATQPEQREEAKQGAPQILSLAQPDMGLDMMPYALIPQ
jgi:hypothetical protein